MLSRQYVLHVELQRDTVPSFDAYPQIIPDFEKQTSK